MTRSWSLMARRSAMAMSERSDSTSFMLPALSSRSEKASSTASPFWVRSSPMTLNWMVGLAASSSTTRLPSSRACFSRSSPADRLSPASDRLLRASSRGSWAFCRSARASAKWLPAWER